MAAIFRPTYTEKLPNGRKVTKRSPTWWIEYQDPRQGRRIRVKGYRDRMATELKASDLERKAQRAAEGAVDPFEEMRRLPISEHLEAYETHLQNKGVSLKYLKETVSFIKAVMEFAKAVRLDELRPGDIENFLRDLKEHGRRLKKEKKDGGNVMERGAGAKTRNTYLAAVRAFYRWSVRTKRISPDADPTLTLSKAAEAEDVRRERRALTEADLGKLLEAARTRPLAKMKAYRKWAGLTPELVKDLERSGVEHALIYKMAILTGLRRGELQRLTWDDLDIGCLRPSLLVRAEVAKSGRAERVAIRPDLERELLAWREMNPRAKEGDLIFRVPRDIVRHLKADLIAAGLDYTDDQGRVFDFHSFRHCTATHLAKGGVAPRTAQAVMRHKDIMLTMGAYTDPMLLDKARAMEALPQLPSIVSGDPAPQAQEARATGTDGRPALRFQASPYKGTYKDEGDESQLVGATAGCNVGPPGLEPGPSGL